MFDDDDEDDVTSPNDIQFMWIVKWRKEKIKEKNGLQFGFIGPDRNYFGGNLWAKRNKNDKTPCRCGVTVTGIIIFIIIIKVLSVNEWAQWARGSMMQLWPIESR